MTQSLNDFIRDKSRKAGGSAAAIDWDARRDEYLAAVATLYEQVRGWLHSSIEQGNAKVSTRRREIDETHIGSYTVDDLVLTVGDEDVMFMPRGRNILGASGRVDVSGDNGEATLLLMPGPRWSLLASRQPTMRIEPLDESRFASLLRTVMRP